VSLPVHHTLRVEPFGYPLVIGAGDGLYPNALATFGAEKASSVALISDAQVAATGHLERVEAGWRSLGVPSLRLIVPAGESSKQVSVWAELQERLAAAGGDRDLWVCAVGGGVVGDLAGFVAASYLRGVSLVQVPTTLLAMVDSSIGGKTGLNLQHGKNLVGAFWQPRGVVADVGCLATLPTAVLREGVVELYKHALLRDAAWRPARRGTDGFILPNVHEQSAWSALVAAAVQVKADVVAEDPHERGVRAHLNLGHTLAHALEGVTGGTMRHGTAVAYGLLYAAMLGRERGWVDWVADARALVAWAADAPLPAVDWGAIWRFMALDKKRRGGRVRLVLLRELGLPERVDDLSPDELERTWLRLRSDIQGGVV
jgi:3-dehydroquinate synthase